MSFSRIPSKPEDSSNSSLGDDYFRDPENPTSSPDAIDNLANTPKPPPELSSEKVKERYKYLIQTTNKARIFYEADKTLDREDRVELSNAYRNEMYSQYVGGLAGLVAGIQLPKVICKYLGKPYKPAYSTLTAVVTVMVGYGAAVQMTHQYNLSKYQGNRRFTDILKSTDGYPPIIGYTYYQETIRRPDSTFPDPSKFDWTKYPAFPLVLTSYGWYRKEIKGLEETTPSMPYRRPANRGGDATRVPHTNFDKDETSELTKTQAAALELPSDQQAAKSHSELSTWERIRLQNQGKPFQFEPQHPQPPHTIEQLKEEYGDAFDLEEKSTDSPSSPQPTPRIQSSYNTKPESSEPVFQDPYSSSSSKSI